jgi:hypothetical protein
VQVPHQLGLAASAAKLMVLIFKKYSLLIS